MNELEYYKLVYKLALDSYVEIVDKKKKKK